MEFCEFSPWTCGNGLNQKRLACFGTLFKPPQTGEARRKDLPSRKLYQYQPMKIEQSFECPSSSNAHQVYSFPFLGVDYFKMSV